MQMDADNLFRAVELWRRDEARARIYRWRGADAPDDTEIADFYAVLATEQARDAANLAAREGRIDDAEHGALLAHLARAAADAVVAPVRGRLRAVADAEHDVRRERRPLRAWLEVLWNGTEDDASTAVARSVLDVVAEFAPSLVDARREADRAALAMLSEGPRHPDAGPSGPDAHATARALLDATAALGDTARDFLSRGSGLPWTQLMVGLRAEDLDGLCARRDRFRRLAALLGALGAEREMNEFLRVEPRHDGVDPRVRIAAVDVPRDVRLAPGPRVGMLSELAAFEGIGRGLALVLRPAALPVGLRRAPAETVGRGLGIAFVQLLAEPAAQHRLELVAAEGARLRRYVGAVLTLALRASAAGVLCRGAVHDTEAPTEVAASTLSQAFGVPVPPPLALLLAVGPSGAGLRMRGLAGGLAAYAGLRDNWDEDWFRNPRAGEPIRAACRRGGLLSVEGWVEELGVTGGRSTSSSPPLRVVRSEDGPEPNAPDTPDVNRRWVDAAARRLRELLEG